jgi:putative hydrolase of the HAD superfamily
VAGAPRVRAVSFDLFDTLVDLVWEDLPPSRVGGVEVGPSTPALHGALGEASGVSLAECAAALRSVDRSIRRERYVEGREVSTRERFAALLRALGREDEDLVERLRVVHMGRLRGQVRELAHHPGLLAALRARLPLGVCSNFTDARTALSILDAAELAPHLDAVAISESVGWRKPRAEIFEAVLGALGVAPGELLHVGDNLDADVAGAAALGIRTVWLTRRVADPAAARARYAGPPPDYELAYLAGLPALLGGAG